MTLDPLRDAGPAVLIHLVTVLPAAAIGAWLILGSRKGAAWHRRLGYLFLILMAVTAFAALFITETRPGAFSWIHLLIPVTLYAVIGGLHAARRHEVRRHRNTMLTLYAGALLIAGGFTLLPGRLLHTALFGP